MIFEHGNIEDEEDMDLYDEEHSLPGEIESPLDLYSSLLEDIIQEYIRVVELIEECRGEEECGRLEALKEIIEGELERRGYEHETLETMNDDES